MSQLVEDVLDGLDDEHVKGCAELARREWDGGSAVWEVCYQPGDGTHYALLFTVLKPGVRVVGAPGGGAGDFPAHTGIGGGRFDGTLAVVTWLQRGQSAVLGRLDFVTPGWVASRYDSGPASAIALAVLLNEITQRGAGWRDRMIAQTSWA
jgi:hypothetical protein